jgi:hypothetical protein
MERNSVFREEEGTRASRHGQKRKRIANAMLYLSVCANDTSWVRADALMAGEQGIFDAIGQVVRIAR